MAKQRWKAHCDVLSESGVFLGCPEDRKVRFSGQVRSEVLSLAFDFARRMVRRTGDTPPCLAVVGYRRGQVPPCW